MEKQLFYLNRAIDQPEVGPALQEGDMVYVQRWCGQMALVVSCIDIDGETLAWVEAEDLEPVE